MRLILDCDPDRVDDALELFRQYQPQLDRSPRPGWGWHAYLGGKRYFVRSTKGGYSVGQMKDPDQ